METKIFRICGVEKPITDFAQNHQYKDGWDTRCKCCKNKGARLGYHARKENPKNPALADFTPRELIEELRARGFKGTLEFTKTITL